MVPDRDAQTTSRQRVDMPGTEDALASAQQRGAPQRSVLQFGLQGLLLLTALIAVWGTHLLNLRTTEHLESRIGVLRKLAAELVVDDPGVISVVKRIPMWYDENRWDLFLPHDGYRLYIATAHVDDQGVAPPEGSVPLPAGRVQLELKQTRTDDGWTVSVLQDEQEVLVIPKPGSWYGSHDTSGGGYFDGQQELSPDEQVILFRRRFMVRSGNGSQQLPQAPSAGQLLWIEPPEQRLPTGQTSPAIESSVP